MRVVRNMVQNKQVWFVRHEIVECLRYEIVEHVRNEINLYLRRALHIHILMKCLICVCVAEKQQRVLR